MKKTVAVLLCIFAVTFAFSAEKKVKPVKIAGYKLTQDEDVYKLTAPCIRNFGQEELIIKDIVLKGSRIASGGNIEIEDEYIQYSLDGWNIQFETLCLTKKGLEGTALFFNKIDDKHFFYVTFNNFRLFADGSFDAGKISTEEGFAGYCINNYSFEFENLKFVRNKNTGKYEFTADETFVTVYYEDDCFIKFGKSLITSDLNFAMEPERKYNFSFVSMNGYDIEAQSVAFKDEQIVLKGSLAPYGWTEKGAERIKTDKDIIVQPDFCAYSEHVDVNYDYSYAGWNIKGNGFEFGEEYLTVDSNVVKFREVELELGNALYYSDGGLYDTLIEGQNTNIFVLSEESLIKETRFSDDGLYVSMEVIFPEVFFYSGIDYMSVMLHQDGTFEADRNIEHKGTGSDNFAYDFNFINLSKDGLYVDEISFQFPKLQNMNFTTEGMTIGYDGKITLHSHAYPFKFCNMVFLAKELSIEDGILDLKGTVDLPNEAPGILSGRTVGIDSFKIDMINGNLISLEAKLEGDYVFPLTEKLSMMCRMVALTYENELPVIYFDDSKVILPASFKERFVEVSKACMIFNGDKFDWDWEAMDLDDVIEAVDEKSRM